MSATVPAPEKTGVRTLRNYVGGAGSTRPRASCSTSRIRPPARCWHACPSRRDDDEAARTAREASGRGGRSTIERTRWLFGFRQALDRTDDMAAA